MTDESYRAVATKTLVKHLDAERTVDETWRADAQPGQITTASL